VQGLFTNLVPHFPTLLDRCGLSVEVTAAEKKPVSGFPNVSSGFVFRLSPRAFGMQARILLALNFTAHLRDLFSEHPLGNGIG